MGAHHTAEEDAEGRSDLQETGNVNDGLRHLGPICQICQTLLPAQFVTICSFSAARSCGQEIQANEDCPSTVICAQIAPQWDPAATVNGG
jgi:hypothetical protein